MQIAANQDSQWLMQQWLGALGLPMYYPTQAALVAAYEAAYEAEKKAKEQEALNDAYLRFKQADQQSMQEYKLYQIKQFREADLKSMSTLKIYWNGFSESELAKYQTKQVGNNCAPNAIAAVYNLLGQPLSISGNELGTKASSMGIMYRLIPSGATMPFNQINIINHMSSITGQEYLTLSAQKLNINLSEADYATNFL